MYWLLLLNFPTANMLFGPWYTPPEDAVRVGSIDRCDSLTHPAIITETPIKESHLAQTLAPFIITRLPFLVIHSAQSHSPPRFLYREFRYCVTHLYRHLSRVDPDGGYHVQCHFGIDHFLLGRTLSIKTTTASFPFMRFPCIAYCHENPCFYYR